MRSSLILALSGLATFAVAEPIPYPPQATSKPVIPADFHPYFGNKKGNFQPTTATTKVTKRRFSERDTGGWVQIEADAVWNINDEDGIGAGSDQYTMYWGDGSAGAGWPTRDQWVSYTEMFNANKAIMFSSCGSFGQADDSGPEVGAIWNAIEAVAANTGVDHRFILATIIQESGGCVRVPTTNYGVRNPGLMQDHNGSGTCNSDITGEVDNPCPDSTITQMVTDGTAGTPDGDGLAQCINESGLGTDADFYRAARLYNSGGIDDSGNLQAGIATHCYSSDIANRLTGWVTADHGCSCDDNPSSCGL